MKQKIINLLFLLALLVPLPMTINADVEQSGESCLDISGFDDASELPQTRGCCKKTKFEKISKLCVRCLRINGSLRIAGAFFVNGFNFSTPESIAAAIAATPGASTTLVGALAAAGAGGFLGYGYVYNVGAQVVTIESPVNFDSNGPLLGITHTPGTPVIGIVDAGTYAISFSVSGVQPNQFTIFVNGAPSLSTVYGSGAGTQQNTGIAILTLAAGDVITLVNHTSSVGPVTLQTGAGGTATNVNASIHIERLA